MSDPVVHLGSQGASLRGKAVSARGSDTKVHGFLGIPYAEPPVGELRFRPPKELRLWTGIRDATQYGPVCPQNLTKVLRNYSYVPNLPSSYSEDCLYLNVWAPQDGTPGHGNRAVLVYLHGGAFVFGCSNTFEGIALAAYEDVVLVTVNYRVGVFGFLRSGSGEQDYHGNMGHLDQIEALKWVQKYICNFGGNPNNVTVVGESAGGISISLHQTSPLVTKGLFHRTIIQSGPALYGNVLWSKAATEKYFHKRLERMGYRGHNAKDLMEFLTTKSTKEVLETFNDWFVPSVLDGIYQTEEPLSSYTHGRVLPVDCLIGFDSSEGLTFIPNVIEDYDQASEVIKDTISKNFYRGKPHEVTQKIVEKALEVYTKGRTDGVPKSAVCDMYGDVNYVAPSILQAGYHSKRGRVYVYLFDHRPQSCRQPGWVRAEHASENQFVFGFPFHPEMAESGRWSEEERDLSRRVMKYWANFAKTGNPNLDAGPIWQQYTPETQMYQPIRQPHTESESVKDFIPERVRLWNSVVPQILEGYSKAKY